MTVVVHSLFAETSNGVSSRAVVAITAPLAVITIVSLVLVVLLVVYVRHKKEFQKQQHYPLAEVSIVSENEGNETEIESTTCE